jgi:ribulose-phosphate 3-epimerase
MDCHMMVSDPARWVADIADAGGASYTFHIEATCVCSLLFRR